MDRSVNPLLVDVIVEKVFQNVSDEGLAACQLVCRLWNSTAKRIIKKRHLVFISSEEEIKQVLERLKNPEYRVYELMGKDLNLGSPLFKKLFTKVLPTLFTLNLQDNKIPSLSDYQEFMLQICPKLTKFDLGTLKTLDGEYIKYFPILDPQNDKKPMVFNQMIKFEYITYTDDKKTTTLLSDVLTAFPKLRALTIANFYAENKDNMKKFQMPQLKHLSIRMIPENSPNIMGVGRSVGGLQKSHIEVINELNLILESLTILNISRSLDCQILKNFIQLQSSTLKELRLTQFSVNIENGPNLCTIPAPSPFPVNLPNLKSLRISKPFVKNLNNVFAGCPNLEDIYFEFYQDTDWSGILTNKIVPQEKIKTATITSIDSKSFAKVVQMFPNLTGLEVWECDDDILRIIFEKCRNLETLTCQDGKNHRMSEEGITGIPKAVLDKLEKQEDEQSDDDDEIEEEKELFKWFDIGCLRKLKFLYLRFNNYPPVKSMISWGFVNLPVLHFLGIKGIEKMDPEFEKFMKKEGYLFLNWKIDMEGALFVRHNCDDSDSDNSWETCSSDSDTSSDDEEEIMQEKIKETE